MGLSRPQIAIEMPIGYLNLDGSTDYDFVLHHLWIIPLTVIGIRGSTRIMILDNSRL